MNDLKKAALLGFVLVNFALSLPALAAPKGAIKLLSTSIFRVSNYYCAEIGGAIKAGRPLSGGMFYPLNAEISNLTRRLKKTTSKNTRKKLKKKILALRKQKAPHEAACRKGRAAPTPTSTPIVSPSATPTPAPISPQPPTPDPGVQKNCLAARLGENFIAVSTEGEFSAINPTGNYVLINDIRFTGRLKEAVVPVFSGHLDGCGFTLSGLDIDANDSGRVGLFGTLFPGSTVENVVLQNFRVGGLVNVGALAGYADNSTIRGVHADRVRVDAIKRVGALVGASHNSAFSSIGVFASSVGIYGNTNLRDTMTSQCLAIKAACLQAVGLPSPGCQLCLDANFLEWEYEDLGGAVGTMNGSRSVIEQAAVCDTTINGARWNAGGLVGSIGRAYTVGESQAFGTRLSNITIGAQVHGSSVLTFGADGSRGGYLSDSIGGVVGAVILAGTSANWSSLAPVTASKLNVNAALVTDLTIIGVPTYPPQSVGFSTPETFGGAVGKLQGLGSFAIQDGVIRSTTDIPNPYINAAVSGVVGVVNGPKFDLVRVIALPTALVQCPPGTPTDQCGTRQIRGIASIFQSNPNFTAGWIRKAAFDGTLAGTFNTPLFYAYSTANMTDGSTLRDPNMSVGLSEGSGWSVPVGSYPTLSGVPECAPPVPLAP